jgi:predicted DNA-binding transcriptional regulator AlpA
MKNESISGDWAAPIESGSEGTPRAPEKFVLLRDVAAHLGISPRSVQKRMTEGLPYHRFGRSVRFLLSEVDAYTRSTLKVDTRNRKIDPLSSTPKVVTIPIISDLRLLNQDAATRRR